MHHARARHTNERRQLKNMNNESQINGFGNFSEIVLQKIFVNSIEETSPDLKKYRLPNLMASLTRRLKLAKLSRENPNTPPTRIVISDFSKKPTKSQRLSDESHSPKVVERIGKVSKRNTRRRTMDAFKGRPSRIKAFNRINNAKQCELPKIEASGSASKASLLVKSHSINNSMRSLPKSFRSSAFSPNQKIPISFQYYSNNSSSVALKTRIKLKDFSKTQKFEFISSTRANQVRDIDKLMLSVKDSLISREKVEKALLIPEDVYKNAFMDFDNARSCVSTPAQISKKAPISKKGSIKKKELPIDSNDSSPLEYIKKEVKQENKSGNLSIYRQKSLKDNNSSRHTFRKVKESEISEKKMDIFFRSKTPIRTIEEKAMNPIIITPKRTKGQSLSAYKMLVKPLDLMRSESDQVLDRKEKSRITCWWTPSEFRKLRADTLTRCEDQAVLDTSQINEDQFKTAIQIKKPSSHTANQITKYMKSPSSIDTLPIDPHLSREYIIHTQSVAQGNNYFRNSISFCSRGPESRPKTASAFYTLSGTTKLHRRRSLSLGHKAAELEPCPTGQTISYLQNYVAREYSHFI